MTPCFQYSITERCLIIVAFHSNFLRYEKNVQSTYARFSNIIDVFNIIEYNIKDINDKN